MLSEIFSYGLDGRQKSIASAIGLRVGRWVYLVDAADDYHKDLKSGAYNPFIEAGKKPDASLFEALRLELGAAKRALDLADGADASVKSITENILCAGMTSPIEDMLSARLSERERKAVPDNKEDASGLSREEKAEIPENSASPVSGESGNAVTAPENKKKSKKRNNK